MTVLRLALLLALGTGTLVGCRACGTSYDYSSPVADCVCGTCGNGRAGSIISGSAVTSGEVIYEENQPQATPAPADAGDSEPTPEE